MNEMIGPAYLFMLCKTFLIAMTSMRGYKRKDKMQ